MRRLALIVLVPLVAILLPMPSAQAHVERPSYWPDPKADCHVSPCAGGKVPKARSLTSALYTSPPGVTRVVCNEGSLRLAKRRVAAAVQNGYYLRPTDHRRITAAQGRNVVHLNEQFYKRCRYHQIQTAVNASRNNDRVVVMPGLYTEHTARSQPTHDPACAKYTIQADDGDPGALSHDYQIHCPNDANLVAVIGRGKDTGPVPSPPLANRHGIPNVGTCIRCNVQLEGSGISPDDVVIEAGDPKAGNKGPSAAGHKKDVGIFVDRADGFVLRNVTVRHAREHDIYMLETDGYLLDRFKAFYAGGYGVLTFVEDHGVVQNCEAAGNGDSGLYPGSGADSTYDRYLPFYPKWRYSQVFRYCDSHHNTGGFSGTDSHGTLITHNNFYNNALGFTTDVFTAPGHPGFPQKGNTIAYNNFYSNNFNPFLATSDVAPFIAAPVGTGLWLAGGNGNEVKGNRFYDNWRRGAMLFAVPDATVCGPEPLGSSTPVPGCNPLGISTSFNNRFHGNKMGVSKTGAVKPNGVDFWWDAFPLTTGNCWWNNSAAPGKLVTSSPGHLPNCSGGTRPSASIGLGNVVNEAELVACLAGLQVSGYPAGNDTLCTWSKTPPRPSSSARTTATGTAERAATKAAQQEELAAVCGSGLAERLCAPYLGPLERVLGSLRSLAEDLPLLTLVRPKATSGRLSEFTCSWWRKADQAHQLGMVQRIRHFAGGRVDGTTAVGYGASMSATRTMKLFEDRCSTFQAGPFALYKIYGAAAPFAALSD